MKKLYLTYKDNVLFNILAVLLLAAASLFISYTISHLGKNVGLVILAGLAGVVVSTFSFINPKFGFYTCIFLGFIISPFERILLGIITLDPVIEALVYVTFIGIIIQKRVRKESLWKNTRHPINYAWIIYVIYLFIELFNPNANSVIGGLFFVRKTIELALIYIISMDVIQTYKDIRFYLYFWIILSALCGAYACYQQWAGLPGFELRWLYSNDQFVGLYHLDNGDWRKWSSLTDPAAFGILMACTAVLCLVLIVELKNRKVRIALVPLTILMLLGMAYSGTRTATFTLLGGILFYVLMTINKLRTIMFAGICAFAFCFIMFAPIYSNFTINRMRSSFQFSKDNSYKVRNTNRERIRPYILTHPIGGGSLTTGDTGIRFYPGHALAGFPSDSGLLKIALEYGWLGLIITCSLYFVILQQGVSLYYRMNKPLIRIFLLSVVCSLFATIISQYAQIAIGASPGIFLFYPSIAIIVRLTKLEP